MNPHHGVTCHIRPDVQSTCQYSTLTIHTQPSSGLPVSSSHQHLWARTSGLPARMVRQRVNYQHRSLHTGAATIWLISDMLPGWMVPIWLDYQHRRRQIGNMCTVTCHSGRVLLYRLATSQFPLTKPTYLQSNDKNTWMDSLATDHHTLEMTFSTRYFLLDLWPIQWASAIVYCSVCRSQVHWSLKQLLGRQPWQSGVDVTRTVYTGLVGSLQTNVWCPYIQASVPINIMWWSYLRSCHHG